MLALSPRVVEVVWQAVSPLLPPDTTTATPSAVQATPL